MGEKSKKEILLDKILNTTQACIFWKDTERRFLGVNQAFLDYYGFDSEAEILGKTDEDMGWHRNPEPFKEDELRVLNGESVEQAPGKCMVKGEERDILASKSPIYDDGKIVGLVGSFIDVTDGLRILREKEALQKKLEKSLRSEKRANRKTSELIGRLRLEMKNPLNAIYTISYLNRYEKDPELLSAAMRRVHAASNYLTTLANDLIDIEGIENETLTLDKKECAFEMIVDGIETVIRPMAEEKGLKFSVRRDYDRKKRLVCDAGRAQQIAINLLLNAVKFTDTGKVSFRVKAADHGEGLKVTYVVEDTGCGIGESFLPRIYDQFAQEKRNPNKYGKGSGLGLTLVKKMVELLDGDISVESEIDMGTKFTVHFVL